MATLFHITLGNRSGVDATGTPRGGASGIDWGLVNTGPFTGLQSAYWSGTEYTPNPVFAWGFRTSDGDQFGELKDGQFFAMAVRPGDVAGMVPEPQTYALLLTGLAALSMVRRRRVL